MYELEDLLEQHAQPDILLIFASFFFNLLIYCWKSINIYIINQLLESLLIFKSKHSYEIFDKSYEIYNFM